MKNLKHIIIIVSFAIAFIVSIDDSFSLYTLHIDSCNPIQTSDSTALHHHHIFGTDHYFQKRTVHIIRQRRISDIQVLQKERVESNQVCSFIWQPPKANV